VNGGLRSRLIGGFIAVTALTVLVSSVTAVIGALFIFATRPQQVSLLGARMLRWGPLSSMSNQALVWLVVVAGLALLALSVGSGLLVAQRVLRPVATLARAAEQVAGGDLTVRLQPSGSDELAQLVGTFNTMTANLGRSMAELQRLETQARRFASDVSHELRSPLASMTAVTEMLSDEASGMSPPAAQAAHLIVREISHLDRLVHDLIEISRFDAGTAMLDTDVLDLAAAVGACLELRGWAGAVSNDVPHGLQATVDRRRLDVILANLVGNALRYGAPPVEVSAARRAGGGIQLSVADRGPGLSADALPHIFERFYKAESARSRSDGSGLGLAIALENARLHDGDLVAQNRPDGGAVFTLVLPAASTVELHEAAP
jgi:two-component system sensor histidine kinase MtrB